MNNEGKTGIDGDQLPPYTGNKSPMRYVLPSRYWTVTLTTVAILTFIVGTSVACLQKGMGNAEIAQACCKGHCHHAMEEALAVKCCQSHQRNVAQGVPVALGVKSALLADSMLSVVLLPIPILHGQAPSRALLFTAQRPPPTYSLYTIHCSLLI
jgi:hypothetical protein